MNSIVLLTVEGEVTERRELTWADLAAIDATWQLDDVRKIDPKRTGGAVALEGILQLVGLKSSASYLTLHSKADDFHASIPLASVRNLGYFVYHQQARPLEAAAGGPVRFLIRDFAACHSSEVDECANVKFVDRIELSIEKGFDNRPLDDKSHEELHQRGDD
jgi:DMSO/TMAO reductase YedYZ molybdopterin-dependent catalytic subunit